MATGFGFATAMGFGVLAGLASVVVTGFPRVLPGFIGLRAAEILAVRFVFGEDLSALAGFAVGDGMLFLTVIRAMPFALRAAADLTVRRAFVRAADFGVAAGLVVRADTPFLVAWAGPFAVRAAADLVIGRAFTDFRVAAGLVRLAVARLLVAGVVPFALRAAADFTAGRVCREAAFAVPAGLARRLVARFFLTGPVAVATRACWPASPISRDIRLIKALPWSRSLRIVSINARSSAS